VLIESEKGVSLLEPEKISIVKEIINKRINVNSVKLLIPVKVLNHDAIGIIPQKK
jgi:hypothetical protein